MDSGEAIAKATVARLHDGGPRRTQVENARALAYPVIVSTALHGLAALVIAMLISGTAGVEQPPPRSTIRATLASPAPKFVVAEPEPSSPTLPAPPVRPPAESVVASVPLSPRAVPREKPSPQGQVIIGPLGTGEAVDRAIESAVRRMYAGAVRAEAEFETPPTGIYPKAALADRRQFQINVAVIVHEDGRVELAQGTFDDTVFAPAIRAALATAKARPLEVNGHVKTSWALVSFTFEYVGGR
jgi:hypothetical protein